MFIDTQYQPVTPIDMNIATQPFTLIRPIIIEGKANVSLLREFGKDLNWLSTKIGPTYSEIRDVILATIDDNENVRVYSNPN
ncbi:YetF domain-containing protein [Paenibacillus crassostreae]|uniref:YetF domain-containing protein n=1 Tax=Paenibacillus crassostreae TaxID=1763538 RepID=UPI0009EDF385|nr:YetF domain-containing protein [Paenibacillus crassostreae]